MLELIHFYLFVHMVCRGSLQLRCCIDEAKILLMMMFMNLSSLQFGIRLLEDDVVAAPSIRGIVRSLAGCVL